MVGIQHHVKLYQTAHKTLQEHKIIQITLTNLTYLYHTEVTLQRYETIICHHSDSSESDTNSIQCSCVCRFKITI